MSNIDNLLNKTMQDLQTKSKAQKNTYKKVVKMHQNVLVFCKGNPKEFNKGENNG